MTASTRFRTAMLSLLLGLALVACGKPSPSSAPTPASEKAGEEDHGPGDAMHGEDGHEEEGQEEGEAIELSAEAVATAGIVTAPAASRRLRAKAQAELQMTAAFVVDFDSKEWIDYRQSTVVETGVTTPLGSGKVAFRDSTRAAAFVKQNPRAHDSGAATGCACCSDAGA